MTTKVFSSMLVGNAFISLEDQNLNESLNKNVVICGSFACGFKSSTLSNISALCNNPQFVYYAKAP